MGHIFKIATQGIPRIPAINITTPWKQNCTVSYLWDLSSETVCRLSFKTIRVSSIKITIIIIIIIIVIIIIIIIICPPLLKFSEGTRNPEYWIKWDEYFYLLRFNFSYLLRKKTKRKQSKLRVLIAHVKKKSLFFENIQIQITN